jgi:uncharacterized membrane protein
VLGYLGMKAYNQVAGTSVDRIAALSDALFAIALTLIVLEVRIPGHQAVMSENELRFALLQLAPRVLTYLLGFLTLGLFWVGEHVLLNSLQRADRNLTWLILAYLATIAIMPVSTGMLADYITYPTAVLVYWLNILATGLVGIASVWYARNAGLLDGPTGEAAVAALKRRLLIGQLLYALGAAICLIHTYWSIAFIVIVQAWLAVGTRLPRRTRRPRGSPARNV